MTPDTPPRLQPGTIAYYGRHKPARGPEQPIKVTRDQILAALPYADTSHLEQYIDQVVSAVAACDVIDARRGADGLLSRQDAMDYRRYAIRILPALRVMRLYPSAE